MYEDLVMRSKLFNLVARWHAWNEDVYFEYRIREKTKQELKAMILSDFCNE